jgi:hypothetical protein
MKTGIKILVLLLLVNTSAVSAKPADESSHNVVRVAKGKDSKSFILHYSSVETERTEVVLVDFEKNVLFKKSYVVSEFAQPFDLHNLPSGQYTLKLKTNDREFVEEINVPATLDVFDSVNLNVELGQRVVKLSSVTSVISPLHLLIVDMDGEVVHKEVIPAAPGLNKSYNLDNVVGKEFTFYVYGNGNLVKEKSVEF